MNIAWVINIHCAEAARIASTMPIVFGMISRPRSIRPGTRSRSYNFHNAYCIWNHFLEHATSSMQPHLEHATSSMRSGVCGLEHVDLEHVVSSEMDIYRSRILRSYQFLSSCNMYLNTYT